ncbi:sensor domain-containing diguanylate cyclase [Paucibacter sp. Y2R2-4]|uniref:GGDEF domain-containing protein n=1 Tax=Paucibacter sp. Y2R2-4 TaxID=2893553 RepID=UPI0021E50B8A|nr:GGDEF domain-containing protein [Paucibacter sp. Y2R2-4]MCV2350260.1 GGDEF domain-containing protein [Paucibacter sp. Y2R2-4]
MLLEFLRGMRCWCRWAFALALGACLGPICQAAPTMPQAQWQALMQRSYTEASEQLQREQALAADEAGRQQVLRRRLALNTLYERYDQIKGLLSEANSAGATLSSPLKIELAMAQARMQIADGRIASAAKLLTPLLKELPGLQDTELSFQLRLAQAQLDTELSLFDQATASLTQLLEELRRAGRPDLAAQAWLALADVQYQLRDYQQGLNYFEAALHQAPDWASQLKAMARMGMAQMRNMVGPRSQAFEELDQALVAFRAGRNLRGEADALVLQSFFLSRDGQKENAVAPVREALALRERLKSQRDVINGLTHLCGCLREVGLLDEALTACQRAAEMADDRDSSVLQWDAHGELANVYEARGNYSKALAHMQRSERALLRNSAVSLSNQTAALRERFESERLQEHLRYEQREQERLTWALSISSLLAALLLAATVALARLYWVTRRLAQVDGLTGLMNRRRLTERCEQEVERAHRHGLALSVLSFDLDHFKVINDELGHAAGDRVLKQLGQLCHSTLRQGDLAGRMGGEEFVLVLPHTNHAAALHLAERLRHLFETQLHAAPGRPVTASFGLVVLQPDWSMTQLLREADLALYAAKHKGRNRVEAACPSAQGELARPIPQSV